MEQGAVPDLYSIKTTCRLPSWLIPVESAGYGLAITIRLWRPHLPLLPHPASLPHCTAQNRQEKPFHSAMGNAPSKNDMAPARSQKVNMSPPLPHAARFAYNGPPLPRTIIPPPMPWSPNQILPPGWDMGTAPCGTTYYMNHRSRTTQWNHPSQSTFSPPLNDPARSYRPRAPRPYYSSTTTSPRPPTSYSRSSGARTPLWKDSLPRSQNSSWPSSPSARLDMLLKDWGVDTDSCSCAELNSARGKPCSAKSCPNKKSAEPATCSCRGQSYLLAPTCESPSCVNKNSDCYCSANEYSSSATCSKPLCVNRKETRILTCSCTKQSFTFSPTCSSRTCKNGPNSKETGFSVRATPAISGNS